MIESPGGAFIRQCKHWRLLSFCFLVSRKRKQNAGKAPLCVRRAQLRFGFLWDDRHVTIA